MAQWRRRLARFALAASLVAAPAAAWAQGETSRAPPFVPSAGGNALSVAASAGPRAFKLALLAPQPITDLRQPRPDELVVDFGGRIDGAALLTLPVRYRDWVQDVRYGYDSLLIVFTGPMTYDFDRRERSLGVTAQPELRVGGGPESAPAESGKGPASGQSAEAEAGGSAAPGDVSAAARPGAPPEALELALLRVRYLRQTGELGDARQILVELASHHPENLQVWRNLADLNRATGRWRAALDAYDAALALAPEEANLRRARQSLLRERRPRVSFGPRMSLTNEPQLTLTDDTVIMTGEVSGFDYLSKRWEIGAATTPTAIILTDAYTRVDGRSSEDFRGLRHQGQLYLRHHFRGGDNATAKLYASGAGVGYGLGYGNTTPRGRWSAEAAFNKPADRPLAARIQGGGIDTLRGRREHRFDRASVSTSLALYARNYRLDGDSWLKSLGGQGGAFWTYYDGQPRLSLGYSLFAEYIKDRQKRPDRFGTLFAPVDLATTEIHSLQTGARWSLGEHADIGGGLGYSFDRFSGDGPFAFASGQYPLSRDWHFRANTSIGLSLRNETQRSTSFSLGGELVWRYAETPRDGLLARLPSGWPGRW